MDRSTTDRRSNDCERHHSTVTPVSILPVAALDDELYHWSHMAWWVCGIGYVLLIAGLAGMTWAESVNLPGTLPRARNQPVAHRPFNRMVTVRATRWCGVGQRGV